MASIYSAGSAAVEIVPDFRHAQQAITKWFAGQDDYKVNILPDVDQANLARARGQIQAGVGNQSTKLNVDVDRTKMAKNFVSAIDFLSGFGTIQSALTKLFDPGNIIKANLAGAGVALGASLGQALGSAALLPGMISAAAIPITTLVVGMQGVGDAFSALASGDVEKIAEAMGNLSREARQFVRATHEFSDEWKALRFDVQNELFDGLSEKMRNLGEKGIPVLREGLSGIAEEFNLAAGSIMDLLSSDSNLADFGTVMDNIREVIHEVALAARPLLEAFFDIATVGSEFLPPLVAGFGQLAQDFANFIQAARDNGDLAKFMSGALSAFGDVLMIVKQLGGALRSIFSAALPAGGELLGIVKNLATDLNAFLKTDVAQSGLSTFFDGVAEAVDHLQPAIGALVEALVTGILPAVGQFAATLAPVVSGLLVQFADMLSELAPLVYPALGDAIAALVSALAPLIPQFTEIIQTILPPLTDLISQLAPKIGEVSTAVGDGLVGAVDAIAPMLPDLVDAIMAIVDAFVPFIGNVIELTVGVLPPFVLILRGLVTALEFIAPILPIIAAGFLAWKAVSGITGMISSFSQSLSAMAQNAAFASYNVGGLGGKAAGVASNGLGKMAGALGAVAGFAGPVGLAVAGVGMAVAALSQAHDAATATEQEWAKAMLEGGEAAKKAREEAGDPGWAEAAMEAVGLAASWEDAQTEAAELYLAMTPLEQAHTDVKQATNDLALAIKEKGINSYEASYQAFELDLAERRLKEAEREVEIAMRGANGELWDKLNVTSQLVGSQLGYERSVLDAKDAISGYRDALKDANVSEDDRARALITAQERIEAVRLAAEKKAEQENAGLPAQEIARLSIIAQRDAVNAMITELGFVPPTLQAMVDHLNGPTAETLAAAQTNLGNTRTGVQDLETAIRNVPESWEVGITADPSAARTTLNGLITEYQGKVIQIGGIIANGQITPGRTRTDFTLDDFFNVGPKADGGKLRGPGTGRSDSMIAAVSNGEWVIKERSANQYGDDAMRAVNEGFAEIIVPAFADGGRVFNGAAPSWYGKPWQGGAYADPVDINRALIPGLRREMDNNAAWLKRTIEAMLPQVGDTNSMFNLVKRRYPSAILTSHYRANDPGWHGRHRAIDIAGPDMAGISRFLTDTLGGRSKEIIYDGPGDDRRDYKNGRPMTYSAATQADHRDHVHWAYDRGGYLPPGITSVFNGTGRPEPVLTAAEHDSLMRWRMYEKGDGSATSVNGFVNNGTVLTTDLGELGRQAKRGTQRAMASAGIR